MKENKEFEEKIRKDRNCPICGEVLGQRALASPEPKEDSDKKREDLIGHRSCWRKEAFKDLMQPGYPPEKAGSQADKWVKKHEIDSPLQVIPV